MTSPQRSRPGAFLPDWSHGDRSLPPQISNIHTESHIFQPPKTPLAASPILRSSSMMSSDSTHMATSVASTAAGRKRSHYDYATGTMTMPQNRKPDMGDRMENDAEIETLTLESPLPFVNTNYRIAGGLDTPSMRTANLADPDDGDDDIDARRNIGYFPQQDSQPTAALPLERNGHARTLQARINQQQQPGWSSSVFGLMGGVAGKIWSFGSKAFKGFYAGGGKGYSVDCDPSQSIWQDVPPPYVTYRSSPNTTPVPGEFPIDDYIPDYIPSSPERPAKRPRQDRQNTDPWVLVPSKTNSFEGTPSAAGPLSSSTSPRRIVISSASRRSVARKPKRSSINTPLTGSPVAHLARPSMTPRATASPSNKGLSPAAADAKRFSAKRRREERETNASMERFNQRLKDMIREGKEALGTRIDVHGADEEDEDEEVEVDTSEMVKLVEQLEDEGIVVDDATHHFSATIPHDRYSGGGGGRRRY